MTATLQEVPIVGRLLLQLQQPHPDAVRTRFLRVASVQAVLESV